MNVTHPVRWMVVFYYPDGNWRDEPDFPQVDFWHPNRAAAREEAARVLFELREEREDHREWVAAGHPDPLEVASGRHPGGQWFLRYKDLQLDEPDAPSEERKRKLLKSAAGGWRGLVDGEQLKQALAEARRAGSKGDVEP